MRFATKTAAPTVRKAPTSLGIKPVQTTTGNGAVGYRSEDPHVELFNLAITTTLKNDFYETQDARVDRLKALVPQCDPEWLQGFIPWLRNEVGLRTVSIVLAAEYASTWEGARSVVASALARPDEPGEFIAYWMSRHGRSMGGGVKRGVADAVQRLYNETALLRFDGKERAWRFGDVIEFVHPTPTDETQSHLFRFALDRRRHGDETPETLQRVRATLAAERLPQSLRTTERLAELLADRNVVFSHERAAGWLGRPLTGADWEALIPSMRYLALLRNLNAFDKAGVSARSRALVQSKLLHPAEISGSKVMPFQFVTAYAAMESDRWRQVLNDAAEIAMSNVPRFAGRTLIMVDRSGSMHDRVTDSRSILNRAQVASYIATVLFKACESADVYAYDTRAEKVEMKSHSSTLGGAVSESFRPRGGTNTWQCTNGVYMGHDQVVVITDEQSSDRDSGAIKVPVITWNVAGYQAHHAPHNGKNRLLVSGFSDQSLAVLPHLLGGHDSWPWERA